MEIGDVLMGKSKIVKGEWKRSGISPLAAGICTVRQSTAVRDQPFLW